MAELARVGTEHARGLPAQVQRDQTGVDPVQCKGT